MSQNRSIDVDAIIDRIREVMGVSTDIALCRALELGTSTVSTWRIKKRVPYAECMKLALHQGVSMDWLLLGIAPRQLGVMAEPGASGAPPEDPRVARMLRFIQAWPAARDSDDVAWLERTLARAVHEYGEWLADQAAETSRTTPVRPDKPGPEGPADKGEKP